MAMHIRGRYSSLVELGVPLLGGTEGWDEGEAASLHWPVSTAQTNAVQEHGTYGGQGKAVGRVPPGGFAANPQMTTRRFPPLWTVEELDACFVVRDHSGQQLAYVYYEEEPGRRSAADCGEYRQAARAQTPPRPRRIAINASR